MSAASKANEPSMEEILASIRRIIADDIAPKPDEAVAQSPERPAAQAAPMKPASPAAAPRMAAPAMAAQNMASETAPDDGDDILDLATVPSAAAAVHAPLRSQSRAEIEFRPDERAGAAAPAEAAARAPAPSAKLEPDTAAGLLAPEVDASVAQAFGSLGAMLVPQGGRTVEDLVKEMMRPMLKSWLDDNLPQIVERLVRAEIERLSRSFRG